MWNSGYSRVVTDDLEDDPPSGVDETDETDEPDAPDAPDNYRLRLVTVCAILVITPVLFMAGKAFLW